MEEEFRRRRSISKDKIIFTRENRRKNSRTWKLQNQVVEKKEKKTVYSVSSSQNDDIRLFVLESMSAFPFFIASSTCKSDLQKSKNTCFNDIFCIEGSPNFSPSSPLRIGKRFFPIVVLSYKRFIDASMILFANKGQI